MTTTWNAVLGDFEDHLRQLALSPSTVTGYVHDMRGFLIWLSQDHPSGPSPLAFSTGDVERYKHYLVDSLGRSPASINRTMQSVRKFGRFAQKAGLLDNNPAQAVPLVQDTSTISTPRILSRQEARRLVEASGQRRTRTAERDHAILHLLLEAGIRVSELVALTLPDIDLAEEPGLLTVRGQGGRPERQVPLSLATRSALLRHLDQPRPAGIEHLFLGRDFKPLSIRSVQQAVASVGRTAGLQISAKCLRDTYAATLWQTSGDLTLLTERMGFRRPEAALRYISHPEAHAQSST